MPELSVSVISSWRNARFQFSYSSSCAVDTTYFEFSPVDIIEYPERLTNLFLEDFFRVLSALIIFAFSSLFRNVSNFMCVTQLLKRLVSRISLPLSLLRIICAIDKIWSSVLVSLQIYIPLRTVQSFGQTGIWSSLSIKMWSITA